MAWTKVGTLGTGVIVRKGLPVIWGATSTRNGVNLAGLEFGHNDAPKVPGTAGVDYFVPVNADFQYLALQGVKKIRLPFLSERELTPSRLSTLCQQINAAGMTAILDMHNYGRKFISGTQELLGSGWAVSDWTSQWADIANDSYIKSRTDVEFDLMNEPHDLNSVSGTWTTSQSLYPFTTTIEQWAPEDGGDTAVLGTGGSAGSMVMTLAANSNLLRVNNSNADESLNAPGKSLRARVRCTNTGGATYIRGFLQVQNASYSWSFAGAGVDLVDGQWHDIIVSPSEALWANHRGFALQVDTNTHTNPVVLEMDLFDVGSMSDSLAAYQVWEQAAQQCVTAIRNTGATNKIYVETYGWASLRYVYENHPLGWWITDPNTFPSLHFYFDADNSGTYNQSYSAETSEVVASGYTAIADKINKEMARARTWASGKQVFIGEVGWPHDSDSALWNADGALVLNNSSQYGWEWTYWATGSAWGNSYSLSAYTGTPLNTNESQATILNSKYSNGA